jgi:hypothetical protein
MNIVTTIEQYKDECIYFCDPIKNNIIADGRFIRIIYSTPEFVSNGIFLLINLQDVTIEKFYNKFKCVFNITQHKELICEIKVIEEHILKKFKLADKIPQFKIFDQLKSGCIKIFSDNSKTHGGAFLLKISGIWETELCYGLTYKFMKVSPGIQ